MFVWMIYNKAPEETKILSDISSNVIVHFTEEETKLFCVKRALEAKRLLEREQLLDYAFMEVSPMKYLTPDIRAASLLLRSFNKEQCERTVREFFRMVLEKREKPDKRKVLLVQNRSGQIALPFQKIYYIEARQRKIFIRLRNMEYCEYGTLEHVMKLLPESFLQCHRSFVFNMEELASEYGRVSRKLEKAKTVCLEEEECLREENIAAVFVRRDIGKMEARQKILIKENGLETYMILRNGADCVQKPYKKKELMRAVSAWMEEKNDTGRYLYSGDR